MIEGNDGGANVSFNGGASWSTIYNQKTAQFYRIDVDNQYPYRVYGTQQDNTSISVPSASEWGVITLADCSYPGTGESGLHRRRSARPQHRLCRRHRLEPRRRRRAAALRPPHAADPAGQRLARGIDRHRARRTCKYRFAWTFPIVFSPHDPGTLYAGGNCVFRTPQRGHELGARSRPTSASTSASAQGASGGQITRESAGAEVHATCACVVESPHRRGEIWASTDDGLVHVTRDDGKSWKNVTPKGMPELAYVGCVEVSAHDADTIYVAATRYKLADYKPYLFSSSDGGQELEVDQRRPAEGRDHPRRARRSGAPGPAVRRHRDRHPFQPRRRRSTGAACKAGLP